MSHRGWKQDKYDPMYAVGFDIGSSSVKASLVHMETGKLVAKAQYPETEMAIQAPQPGWAEQDPDLWWECVGHTSRQMLAESGIDPAEIGSIGIAYQMHGLVMVDENLRSLRPSIIWCDSRAVDIGQEAFEELGQEFCLSNFLNSPGNFTASKLQWVRDNQPEIYRRIRYIMLPGDYVALRLTGKAVTTPSGLSEGVLWNFRTNNIASEVANHAGVEPNFIPTVRDVFSDQGEVTQEASLHTGLPVGAKVTYRAGDQPNNALSLGVLEPGEVAATGGTSGVVYGITDRPVFDKLSRVNGFAHVNHSSTDPRIGVLLCVNGAGIQYAWIRRLMGEREIGYPQLEELAASVPIGSDGLTILPFGNGAERILVNKNVGARVLDLDFNRHTRAHLARAALEGIAFAFVYGVGIMREMGVEVKSMKVGNDNLFQSTVFSNTIATLLNCTIQVIETTGSTGAAFASGLATGEMGELTDIRDKLGIVGIHTPDGDEQRTKYERAFEVWSKALRDAIAE